MKINSELIILGIWLPLLGCSTTPQNDERAISLSDPKAFHPRHSYQYANASDEKHGISAVAQMMDERVCVSSSGMVGKSMIFVVYEDVEAIKPILLRKIVEHGIKVKSIKRRVLEEHYDFPLLDEIANDFGISSDVCSNNVAFANSREESIRTDQYNRLKDIDGSSELKIRLIDGKHLSGEGVSIIIITRTDRWKGRAQIPWTRIPLPSRVMTFGNIITEREVLIIDGVLNSLNEEVIFFQSDSSYAQLRNKELFESVKSMVAEDLKKSEKTNEIRSGLSRP